MMRLSLFSLFFFVTLPGLQAGHVGRALPPFRPLCDQFASPFDQIEPIEVQQVEKKEEAGETSRAEVSAADAVERAGRSKPQTTAAESVRPSHAAPVAGQTASKADATCVASEPESSGELGPKPASLKTEEPLPDATAAAIQADSPEEAARTREPEPVAVAPMGANSSEPSTERKEPVASSSPHQLKATETQEKVVPAAGKVPLTSEDAVRSEGVDGMGTVDEASWNPAALPSLRCKVLLAGDTMMEDFALQLNRDLRPRRGYNLRVVTRRSSCLSSSGRFNFAEKLDDAITELRPDVVVLLLGCWDDVAIRTDEGYAVLGTPAWDEAYRQRVQGVLEVLQRQGVPAIWVGLPVMGSKNAQSLHRLTEITGELVGKSAVRFIDNRDVLADAEGNYQVRESRPGREQVLLRRRDGKHTTRAGDELLVERFLPVFSQVVGELEASREAKGDRKESPEELPITDVHSQLFR